MSESCTPSEGKQKQSQSCDGLTTELVWVEASDAEERLRRAYELILRASKRSEFGDHSGEDN